jgi:endonuclease/exonuclease/phosphatase (EEP) superfamily protein YafD
MEVNAKWLENLQWIRGEYSYKFEAPQENYSGLALYSRLPFHDPKIVYFGASATPAIVATFAFGEGFDLILAHPAPPMDSVRAGLRNLQLSEIADYIAASEKNVVLAGDLNTTMWSPYYADFANRSMLKNARTGYGIGATWPPIPVFGVPIDHILATSPVHVSGFKVHRSVGSDHLPISADILIPPPLTAIRQENCSVDCVGETTGTHF